MEPEVVKALWLTGGLIYGVIGLFLGMSYFESVNFHGVGRYSWKRDLVPCDWLLVLLFGPIVWVITLLLVIGYFLEDRDLSWLSPSTWSEWVGEKCPFKKKDPEVKP